MIDKLFNKKKIENYWYYYKYHTIFGLFALVVLSISLVECVNRVNPDLEVTYIGGVYIDVALFDTLKPLWESQISDVDQDGNTVVNFYSIPIPDEPKNEMDITMREKAMIEMAAGESRIYIMDTASLQAYSDILMPLSDQVLDSVHLEDNSKLYIKDGEPVAVSLAGRPILQQLGLPQDSYIALRVITQPDSRKRLVNQKVEEAKKLTNYILSQD